MVMSALPSSIWNSCTSLEGGQNGGKNIEALCTNDNDVNVQSGAGGRRTPWSAPEGMLREESEWMERGWRWRGMEVGGG